MASREYTGDELDAGSCVIVVEAGPGDGPQLHRHPYEEVFVVQEGVATFTLDGEEREVRAGEVVVAPAGVAHRFVNSGDGPLRQVDIHVNRGFDTEWL
jgi:mannose-6-phosphate isomerase-like protein (cupin superfamily)